MTRRPLSDTAAFALWLLACVYQWGVGGSAMRWVSDALALLLILPWRLYRWLSGGGGFRPRKG